MTGSRILSSWGGALLLAAWCAGPAAALAPPSVTGTATLNFVPPFPVDVTGFGSFKVTDPGGSSQVDVAATPSPRLSGEVKVNPGFTGRAVGRLVYEVQIVGPAGIVPVVAHAAGSVSGTSNTIDPFAGFLLVAQWSLEDAVSGAAIFSDGIATGTRQGVFNDSFSHIVGLALEANHVYRVTLTADAFAAAVSGPTAHAVATIDPVFSFDSGVGSEYSFQFSAGIGNAPVPEPQTGLLLAAGLIALQLLRRRRRPRGP